MLIPKAKQKAKARNLTQSGVFSKLASPLLGITSSAKSSLSIASWNGRGILTADLKLRERKMEQVISLMSMHDAVACLEMHGSPEEFWAMFGRMLGTHEIFFSQGFPSYDAGGVAWFLKRSALGPGAVAYSQTLAPGRVLKMSIDIFHKQSGVAQSLSLVAIHNHALRPYMSFHRTVLQSDIERAFALPNGHASVLVGDLNHIFRGA